MTYILRTNTGLLTGILDTRPVAREPLAEPRRAAFFGAMSNGDRWNRYVVSGRAEWRREDVALAYLLRDGSTDRFTAYDIDNAVLRDSQTSGDVAQFLPAMTSRAAVALELSTLASAYVGQRVLVEGATPGHWLPATVISDGRSVLMPANANLRATALPASTPAAVVIEAREDEIRNNERMTLRTFRSAQDGSSVLGFVNSTPESQPSKPVVAVAPAVTLAAVAAMTPRTTLRIVVNTSGEGDRATWQLVTWL